MPDRMFFSMDDSIGSDVKSNDTDFNKNVGNPQPNAPVPNPDPVPPVTPDRVVIPSQDAKPPDPVKDVLSDPPPAEETYTDWTAAAKLGLALKTLDPFVALEVTKDDDVDAVLTKVKDQWSAQLEVKQAELKQVYEKTAQYVDLVQNGEDDFIKSLAPLRAIAELPLQVSEEVNDDLVLTNATNLVRYYLQETLKDDAIVDSAIDTLSKNNGLITKALEVQTLYKAQHDTLIDNKIKEDTDRIAADEATQKADRDRVEGEVSKILTEGKLFNVTLSSAEITNIKEALYGKPTEVVIVKEQDATGKVVEKQIILRKAEKAFQEFNERPDMQLMFLTQYLRGDFTDMRIQKAKEGILNNALKTALNDRNDPAAQGKLQPQNNNSSTSVGTIEI